MEHPTLAQPNRTNWRNLITVISIMVLIGTEVFGVAIAAGWAIAGLFELGTIVGYVLMGLFGLFALYILAALWRRCTTVEPFTGRA
jgi:predicted membrane channel-forming protein YqfA (hemolysin III family)